MCLSGFTLSLKSHSMKCQYDLNALIFSSLKYIYYIVFYQSNDCGILKRVKIVLTVALIKDAFVLNL